MVHDVRRGVHYLQRVERRPAANSVAGVVKQPAERTNRLRSAGPYLCRKATKFVRCAIASPEVRSRPEMRLRAPVFGRTKEVLADQIVD